MATSDESGMASIYELMANIGATSLASVKRHLDILEQYVPKPVDSEFLFPSKGFGTTSNTCFCIFNFFFDVSSPLPLINYAVH